jgi:hypothetical protein
VAAQLPQSVFAAQGSAAVQALENQAQSEHEPVVGPVDVPVWQELLEPHQPHEERVVQSLHAALEVQGSVGVAAQRLETQRQSEHEPPLGPVEVPVWHIELPAHQPHAARVVQSPQAPLLVHGSEEAEQSVEYQRQSAQLPESGPLELPCEQPPPEPHQPQEARAVQPPQSVALVHGSVVAVWQVPPVQLRPAQQSASVVQRPLPDWQRQCPPLQSM